MIPDLYNGSHQAGKLGAAILYATHEPELPTPAGLTCHGPITGFRFSVKPLRTGIQREPMAASYGRQLIVRDVLPVPAR
ncbi:hypothetical protein [Streptomyces sp. WG7]|uniref:hypothetical protein n=1 Tax=Streptomyces sp. WG7 TaxID=3417650 RepID=UPI003CE7ED8E